MGGEAGACRDRSVALERRRRAAEERAAEDEAQRRSLRRDAALPFPFDGAVPAECEDYQRRRAVCADPCLRAGRVVPWLTDFSLCRGC